MTRSSPGVHRVVAILNFFADHPGQAFTLTDLVRALKLSRATCHALLVGLVECGYLYRASDKSYILGPALAAIGEAAKDNFSPLQVAQPEMRSLADEFDCVCSAVFRERDDVVIRERAASVSHLGFSVARGTRLPLRLPFGGIFFAWSPQAETEAWLADMDPPAPAEMVQPMYDAMGFAREHGYFVGVRQSERGRHAPQTADGSVRIDWLFHGRQAEHPVRALAELHDDESYDLSAVNAPIFDMRGQVDFVLCLLSFERLYTGAEIRAIGERLITACARISRFIAGRRPNL